MLDATVATLAHRTPTLLRPSREQEPLRPLRLEGVGMSNEQMQALHNELRDLKALSGELGQRIDRIEAVVAAALQATAAEVVGAEPAHPSAPILPTFAPVSSAESVMFDLTGLGTGSDAEELYPNGIDGVSGLPLLRIDTAAVLALGQEEKNQIDFDLKNLHAKKIDRYTYDLKLRQQQHPAGHHASLRDEAPLDVAVIASKDIDIESPNSEVLGTIADVDQNQIAEARWAVVVHAQEDVAVLKELWPLIEHRMRQMGYQKLDFDFQSGDTTCGAWLSRHTDGGKKTLKGTHSEETWRTVPPVLLVRPNEGVNAWLKRHNTSQAPVDPALGVPFYLMIVGRPGPLDANDNVFIPWGFQYELDVFWGVGRLLFNTADGRHRWDAYRAYAEQVVDWEQQTNAAQRLKKEIAFFGTRHEGDNSTIRSVEELIDPLVAWSGRADATPAKLGVTPTLYRDDAATRDNLRRLLSASTPPALLFSATHGIGLPLNDPTRLVMHQGALVTADFEYGSIKRDHWFASEDLDAVSEVNVTGMIALIFACYGAGCPQQDEFVFEPNKPRKQIAPFSFVAQLPQRMLAKGALAVLGHVERAWTYSFSGTEGGTQQIQPFQDVIGRLLKGMPAGSATDQFNVIQGARALTLTQELEYLAFNATTNPQYFTRLWMARNDARNYMLLGDPAVRVRVDD